MDESLDSIAAIPVIDNVVGNGRTSAALFRGTQMRYGPLVLHFGAGIICEDIPTSSNTMWCHAQVQYHTRSGHKDCSFQIAAVNSAGSMLGSRQNTQTTACITSAAHRSVCSAH